MGSNSLAHVFWTQHLFGHFTFCKCDEKKLGFLLTAISCHDGRNPNKWSEHASINQGQECILTPDCIWFILWQFNSSYRPTTILNTAPLQIYYFCLFKYQYLLTTLERVKVMGLFSVAAWPWTQNWKGRHTSALDVSHEIYYRYYYRVS